MVKVFSFWKCSVVVSTIRIVRCESLLLKSPIQLFAMPDQELAARYGVFEWFGRPVSTLNQETRKEFEKETRSSSKRLPCLPQGATAEEGPRCSKQGGVCTIRQFRKNEDGTGTPEGPIVTVCPHRFKEGALIFEWTGREIVGVGEPWQVQEVDFLERNRHPEWSRVWGITEESDEASPDDREEDEDDEKDVGRIDGVLLDGAHYLTDEFELRNWCALEIQSVYFSGDRMRDEYGPIANLDSPHHPFPTGRRRPDFRSSSAKRLLPQLQTKVPSLRRWGIKMAVVVDEAFFYEMAKMEEVSDLSNADIAWVVVRYEEQEGAVHLVQEGIHLTTLEDAVIGLTAGTPVSKKEFEDRIMRKIIGVHAEQCRADLQERIDQNVSYRKRIEHVIEQRYRDRKRPLVERRGPLISLEKSGQLTGEQEVELDDLRSRIADLEQQMRPFKDREQELSKKVAKPLRNEKDRLRGVKPDDGTVRLDGELWQRKGNRWLRKDTRYRDECDRVPSQEELDREGE